MEPGPADFADCARGRTVSVSWHCRDQHLAMNSCMIAFATKAEQDAAREEWFTGIIARRQKREEELAAVEKRREEVIQMTRRQEEKERIEAERKRKEDDEKKRKAEGEKKGAGFWWR
jgi:COX assembly mitochondrial protein 1